MSKAAAMFADDEMTKYNSKNLHHADLQYDSADLPFSPPSRNSGYLESGLPFFKSTITDADKYFYPAQTSSDKDQKFSPLLKFATSSSKSHEDVSTELNCGPSRPLITQSLPATPFTTPLSTPAPTPFQTPQSSPSLTHKTFAMDSSSANQDHQLSSNNKWFSVGFRSALSTQPYGGQLTDGLSGQPADSLHSNNLSRFDGVSSAPLSYLQKRALIISNRDMNFLAPTSM